MQAVGVKMARLDMNNWDAVENPKGTYNLSVAQSYVTAFRAAGIKTNLMLGYNSHLYTTSSAGWGAAIVGAANIAGYVAYCLKVAQTFNGPDIIYELGNEPDIAAFWNPVSGSAYGTAMAAAAAAIKKAYPNAVVLTAGISDINGSTYWGPYITAMIASAGAGMANIDGLAFHTYLGGDESGARQPPEWWFNYPTCLPALKSAMAAAPRPVWITEGGFPLDHAGNDATRQAVLAVRAMLTAILMQAKSYIHYDLINDSTTGPSSAEENSYGMYLNDAVTKKPTAAATAALMAIINGCTGFKIVLAPAVYEGDDNYAIGFTGPSGPQTIAWSSKQAGGTISLGVPADKTKVAVTDFFGANVGPAYDAVGNLVVSVSDAGGPLIVTGI